MNYVIFYKNCVTFLIDISSIFILGKLRLIQRLDIMKTNVTGYWNEKKEKLKQKYTTITDEDLLYSNGKEKEMMEMLGYKLGKTKAELVDIIVAL